MISTTQSLAIVAVMSIVTILLRGLPYVLFAKKTPKAILYLGEVLPKAIMAMLVVYCLKNVSFVQSPNGLPEIIAIAIVVALHKWRHSTLLSIVSGTLSYMFLVQVVFK